MTLHFSIADPAASPWTCPFCPLLCDTFSVDADGDTLTLRDSDCPRARAALSRFGPQPPSLQSEVDGLACDLDTAIAAAAHTLAASRQPLFGGLGTDVSGARALYALACRTSAICDPAGGRALLHGLRAAQDRGAFTTTLGEVRARADLIVCVGGLPNEHYPEFLRRCGIGEGSSAQVVVLQSTDAPVPAGAPAAIEFISFEGDLFDAVALLAACVSSRTVRAQSDPYTALAARLHAAHYAVVVHEAVRMPVHGSLINEAINRIVGTLHQRTRAAALPLGGADGASTVNAVFTWLSGLPLRSRAGPAGLEHEPLRFDAQRLLADHAVDALLWVASFGTEPAPPESDLPRIVLGHPGFAAAAQRKGSVFIPVSTPGIGSAGHLFRTDGSVLMPLHAVRSEGLPTVADVLGRLTRTLQAGVAA